MNRYQFEDLISEYIENELSLSKRKEFELYLDKEPNARDKVDQIQNNIALFGALDKVNVSKKFNDNLMKKIKLGTKKNIFSYFYRQGLLFGFKPINATILMGLVIIFFFLGQELINETISPESKDIKSFSDSQINIESDIINKDENYSDQIQKDSLKDLNEKKSSFSNKIHLVND